MARTRHCEEPTGIGAFTREDALLPEVAGPMTGSATKQSSKPRRRTGLLRFARNDEPHSPPFSSPPSSEIRSTDATFSPSAVLNTMTPWVERPAMRMPSTGQRINWPPSVTSMI